MLDLKLLVFPGAVTAIALIVYFALIINVGKARAKYNVPVPQISGNPDFERVFRVQQNTVEQLVLFVPSLWLFCLFVSPIWGAVIGAVWVIGRIIYAWGYYQAAEKRIFGFAINSLSTMILILGSLVGIIKIFATGI
ncbi:MAG TPA: MAPEG domain-containing protein [Cyanobacteria bacterium UBA11149]|nr:MAPEG domain-containing protein [Cyanobacteria bacterium UBA11367]HBE60272.1 MAPEG domain-containing protein [Cyanobacteria bacterium UBA11366]HBK62089.1 MAPEG domain-containing protein [Cyanobacteria bacterium UBA11166]HBR74229.1 MAPEG domain-containing protein [Cyanobacteria bacterium UBA11159]HBS70265.1 MAPEG domain-containing protein [Cyanobacteria bacterium UBA11153]HBW91617.1 MAPEG domain-containing protein [Cyanobacteria bacterium UBA11149]HCA93477.1 MAPEG domain-containing protein 